MRLLGCPILCNRYPRWQATDQWPYVGYNSVKSNKSGWNDFNHCPIQIIPALITKKDSGSRFTDINDCIVMNVEKIGGHVKFKAALIHIFILTKGQWLCIMQKESLVAMSLQWINYHPTLQFPSALRSISLSSPVS